MYIVNVVNRCVQTSIECALFENRFRHLPPEQQFLSNSLSLFPFISLWTDIWHNANTNKCKTIDGSPPVDIEVEIYFRIDSARSFCFYEFVLPLISFQTLDRYNL